MEVPKGTDAPRPTKIPEGTLRPVNGFEPGTNAPILGPIEQYQNGRWVLILDDPIEG